MAAQTDAPDDLIAELARLMADDARGEGAPGQQQKPAPVRIPGNEAAQVAPVHAEPAATAPAQKVRIPGAEAQATPAAPKAPDTVNFDFASEIARKPAGPTTPVSASPVAAPAQPAAVATSAAPVAPAEEPPALDHDSLADLIAAELAADSAPANDARSEPAPQPQTPVRGEDNFGVPPVFGFGSPQQPPQPQVQSAAAVTIVEPETVVAKPVPAAPVKPTPASDALRDIESLVGPALQVPKPEPVAPTAPSPALRSLATPTLPANTPPSPAGRAPTDATSIDEAILAAAAATGAQVEWVNNDVEPDAAEMTPVARSRRRFPAVGLSRSVVGPVVAVALLGAAGLGLYMMLGQTTAPTGPAPLIVADTAPVKEVVEPVETETPQSVVFNEMSGGNDGTDEQLVSRDQANDVEEVVAANTPPPAQTANVIAEGETAAVDPNQDGIVNRRVRTVTVRPDGTIVSGEDSVAGASILPVDRPNVPEVPGADFATPGLIGEETTTAATGTTPAGATGAATTPDALAALDPTAAPTDPNAPTTTDPTAATAATTPATTPVEPGTVVPVVDATGTAVAGRTVATPVARPSNFSQTAATAIANAAAAPATAATATAAAPPPGGTAGAYVQLSSQRTEEAARESAQAIVTRFGPIFGGANLEIQRVDLADRGIYYRVLVPATDRAGASNICTNVQAAGGDCFVL